ncbi:MAG: hypothetical protein ACKO96_17625, partial [Flammeovirgaceae bacterium]
MNANGTWRVVDWVVRDMQILVEDCMATRPNFDLPDQCFLATEKFNKTVKVTDKSGSQVKVEVFPTDNFYGSVPRIFNVNKFQ